MRNSTVVWQSLLVLFALLTASALAQSGAREGDLGSGAELEAGEVRDAALALPQAPSQSKADHETDVEKKEGKTRILGIVPRFGTTDRQDAPPLTPRGKFKLFARSAFDPVTVFIAAAQAGVSQADNQFAGYGQGAEGYGKRFGAAFADQVSSGFFSNFLYPTMFKHDPRYFRLGHGKFAHRFGYSLIQEVVCHTDSGGRAFNVSNVLGAFSSGGLSNAYYPSGDRGFELTMSRSALAVAYGAAGNLLSEFWPDIQRRLLHRNAERAPQQGPPSPVSTTGPK
ncbi:MAG: hypothetical protein WA628_12690 [Terriglobales bacterium]